MLQPLRFWYRESMSRLNADAKCGILDPFGSGESVTEPRRDPATGELADKALTAAIGAVPEDSELKRVLKQAGWVGLALAVLIGNIPWSLAMNSIVKGTAPLNMDALETYWSVFVLFTPFVVLFGIAVYLMETDNVPQMPGAMYVIIPALIWWGATVLSLELGGEVPIGSLVGPESTSPGGSAEYIFQSIGTYIDRYGPLPVLAGPVEGAALGYWAALLSRD